MAQRLTAVLWWARSSPPVMAPAAWPRYVPLELIRGSFVLATLDDASDVAYTETAARGLTLGDKQDLQTLNESFAKISAQALPVGMSIDLINRTAEERWT